MTEKPVVTVSINDGWVTAEGPRHVTLGPDSRTLEERVARAVTKSAPTSARVCLGAGTAAVNLDEVYGLLNGTPNYPIQRVAEFDSPDPLLF